MKIDIIELSKDLTLNDIEHLLWIFKPHISVFVGSQNMCQIAGEIGSICFNGASLQINMQFAELDNLTDDEFINHAFYSKANKGA